MPKYLTTLVEIKVMPWSLMFSVGAVPLFFINSVLDYSETSVRLNSTTVDSYMTSCSVCGRTPKAGLEPTTHLQARLILGLKPGA